MIFTTLSYVYLVKCLFSEMQLIACSNPEGESLHLWEWDERTEVLLWSFRCLFCIPPIILSQTCVCVTVMLTMLLFLGKMLVIWKEGRRTGHNLVPVNKSWQSYFCLKDRKLKYIWIAFVHYSVRCYHGHAVSACDVKVISVILFFNKKQLDNTVLPTC